ncbi:MAG: hypothetical protein Q7T80_10735 [Methanoregula sp.]|nr:hypothetical protein [Methanoregula sp.]
MRYFCIYPLIIESGPSPLPQKPHSINTSQSPEYYHVTATVPLKTERAIARDGLRYGPMQGTNGANVNAPALAMLNTNGAQAKTITSLYIHAKVAVADFGTPHPVADIGSEYVAPVSLDQSRGLAILVSELPILDRIESVFAQYRHVPVMPALSVTPKAKAGPAS